MTSTKEQATTPPTDSSSNESFNREYVPRRFDQRAAATPEAVALVSNTLTLTYAELERRANRLSQQLRSLGVGPNVLVGLFLDRSVEFVAGALSILKAGGAFVPLDPSVPAERLRLMLHDAQPSVVVAHSRTQAKLPSYSGKLVLVDEAPENFLGDALEPAKATLEESDIAYVIYTSGSTGQPNGVEITHGGLRNLVNWHQRAFEVTPFDRASHQAPIGFDAAVWEIWPYLCAGATVYLAPHQITCQAEKFRDWLLTQKITIAFATTALAERMLSLPWPEDTPLRILLTGADVLHVHPSAQVPFKLVNNYGPTECTVVTTSGLVPAGEQQALPTIGRPIDNTRVYILDEAMREARVGEAGEIYVGGAGVARGYLNRPQLTATRFVSSPFADGKEARLYRTGDLGRYLPDGQIAFLGRQDEQVKIRGYRVELEEIVCHLDAHPDVHASAVTCREDNPGDKQLIAYVVLAPHARPEEVKLREFLSMRLPEYMVPTAFVRVEALPLTEHGKIDRAKLPAPDDFNLLRDESFGPPRTPIEERLVAILAPLLRVGSISLNDNFFFLGGHSLLGAQVISRINQTFRVEMTLLSLFEHPTVAEIAAEIERLVLAKMAASGSSVAQGSISLFERGHSA